MSPILNFSQQASQNFPNKTGQIIAYQPVRVNFKLDAGSWKSNQLRGRMIITKGGKPVETLYLYSTGANPETDKTGIVEVGYDLVETGTYDYELEIQFNYVNSSQSNRLEQIISFTVVEIRED